MQIGDGHNTAVFRPHCADIENPPNAAGGFLYLAAIGWIAFIFVFYCHVLLQRSLPGARQLVTIRYCREFFDWQALGFFVVAFWKRPSAAPAAGRRLIAYIALSTVALWLCSRQWQLPLAMFLLTGWTTCSLQTIRLALARYAGDDNAGWGSAAACLFAFWIVAGFFLASAGLMCLSATLPIVVAMAVPGLIERARHWRPAVRTMASAIGEVGPFGLICIEAIWLMLAFAFVCSSIPETASDSSRVYLSVVQNVANQHRLLAEYADQNRLLPKAIQVALAPACLLGGLQLVKWFAWFSVVGIAIMVGEEILRCGGRRADALFGAAAALACPLLLDLSTCVYMDQFIALIAGAGMLVLVRAIRADSRRALFLSAFLMGCANQIKYNALLFSCVWAGALAIGLIWRRGPRRALGGVVVPSALLAAVSLPWFIHTYRITGNPLYPFLNQLFQSPYFPAGMATMGNLNRFVAATGPLGWLLFPWRVTFQTSLVGEMPDGGMGFWILALIPCIFLSWRVLRRDGLDIAIVAVAMIAAVCATGTQYARYWLPAVPLLMIPLVLSFGRIKFPRFSPEKQKILALGYFGVLMLPAIVWASTNAIAWDVYTRRVARDDFLSESFPGYRLVREINPALNPDDGILCTGYDGIYTISARAYEFAFWHTIGRNISDDKALGDFFSRNRIRYWMINYAFSDQLIYFREKFECVPGLLSEPRFVAASGGCALFDLSPQPPKRSSRLIETRAIPATGWQADFTPAAPRQASIQLNPKQTLTHKFSVSPGGPRDCRVAIAMAGEKLGDHMVRIGLEWLDGDNRPIGFESSMAMARTSFPKFEGRLFSSVPANARSGVLTLKIGKPLPVFVNQTTLEFRTRE